MFDLLPTESGQDLWGNDFTQAITEATGHSIEPQNVSTNTHWRFEEAEMPSLDAIGASLDGLYYCPRETCNHEGFLHKSLLR